MVERSSERVAAEQASTVGGGGLSVVGPSSTAAWWKLRNPQVRIAAGIAVLGVLLAASALCYRKCRTQKEQARQRHIRLETEEGHGAAKATVFGDASSDLGQLHLGFDEESFTITHGDPDAFGIDEEDDEELSDEEIELKRALQQEGLYASDDDLDGGGGLPSLPTSSSLSRNISRNSNDGLLAATTERGGSSASSSSTPGFSGGGAAGWPGRGAMEEQEGPTADLLGL